MEVKLIRVICLQKMNTYNIYSKISQLNTLQSLSKISAFIQITDNINLFKYK